MSAPRTIAASRSKGGVARANSSIMTSNVQQFAAVAPEHVLDVKGRGVEPLADGYDLGRRDIEKHRIRIDKAADQPGTGDAVDLWPRARYPHGAALGVARRQFGRIQQRKFGLLPALEAAFERFGRDVGVPQPGRGALRELGAAQANNDCGVAGEIAGPVASVFMATPDGAGNQPRVGGEIGVGTNVDQDRRVRGTDQPQRIFFAPRAVPEP